MSTPSPNTFISSEESFLLSIYHSLWRNRCVSVIVGLKIPDIICSSQETSISIDEIADKSGCDSTEQLYPMMRLAAQWGIGIELENKHFAKNKALELLRRDKGPSFGHLLEYYMGDELYSGLRSLPACVKHGKPSFETEHGMTHTQYMYDLENCPYSADKMYEGASKYIVGSDERRHELAEVYEKAMQYRTRQEEPDKLLKAFPWPECKKIIDIGGSTGDFLGSILKLPGCENIQGYVLELPEVVDEATKKIVDLGIEQCRIQFIKHDCFKPFSTDLNLRVDTVIIKNVLCMFTNDNERMTLFFTNCHTLFPAKGGRLLIIDNCIPDLNEQVSGDHLKEVRSLHLLNICGTSFLSKKQWCELFAEVGINKMGYNVHKIHGTFNGGVSPFLFELHYSPVR